MSLAFLLTAMVIVATPGTGALYTISTGITRGRRPSVIAALGCTIGIVPHLAAAITGTQPWCARAGSRSRWSSTPASRTCCSWRR